MSVKSCFNLLENGIFTQITPSCSKNQSFEGKYYVILQPTYLSTLLLTGMFERTV